MALSLFAIRTNTRRGTQSKKPKCQGHAAMVARRHWKEGEEQLQPAPQTYVNLVQMLMPHPKAPQTNMPQQV
uniref:Uncharacterized protein n=1 Tax=Meloidogyne hapla TaxID=6305 RepID=A0A1I8BXK7_MELHA